MAETQYEKFTARALRLIRAGGRPNDAWLTTLSEIYPGDKLRSQEKHSCPKWAFSILCHSGHIKGVTLGCCPESEDKSSGSYILDALIHLLANPSLSMNKAELKRKVFGVKGQPGYRTPDGELEVLLCLQSEIAA
jgi:hypothetical protein